MPLLGEGALTSPNIAEVNPYPYIHNTYVMITTLERSKNAKRLFFTVYQQEGSVVTYLFFFGRLYETICHRNPVMWLKTFA